MDTFPLFSALLARTFMFPESKPLSIVTRVVRFCGTTTRTWTRKGQQESAHKQQNRLRNYLEDTEKLLIQLFFHRKICTGHNSPCLLVGSYLDNLYDV